ncbi:MAG: hypothetical protein ACOC23_04370 [Thermodesulfobacteriota bacterium]
MAIPPGSVAAIMRDACSPGMETEHIINVWGFEGNLPRLAGKAAEGTLGAADVQAPHRGRSKIQAFERIYT